MAEATTANTATTATSTAAGASLVGDLQSQIGSFYGKLPTKRRWFLLAILLVVVIGLSFMVIVTQQTTWVTLFSGLSSKETAQVVKRLDDSQIEYIIAPGGGGVLVPAEVSDKAKLEIANSDLLNGGTVGLEIFDNSSFTMTEFQQNVQLRRAMEGELARLIQLINVVSAAKVILAIPERTVFIDSEQNPSAAVHLVIKESSPLNSKMVKTILNLVASGVPSLSVEDVKISDQYGNLYSSSLQDSIYDTEDRHLQYTHNVERYLENKAIDQLQRITGKGQVKVKISAEVNNETQQIDEDLLDPELAAVVSEQTIQEKATGARSIPIGVPGVSSNSPEINSGVNEAANVMESDKKTKQTNYENSRRRIRRNVSAGGINRLTISVLLDDKSVIEQDKDGVSISVKKKWLASELDKIKLITQNAVGFSPQRGDSIEVKNITFNTQLEDSIKAVEISIQAQRDIWLNAAKYGLAALITIVVLLFIIRPVLKRISPTAEDMELDLGLPATVSELEGGRRRRGGQGGDDDDMDFANKQGKPNRNKILEMAKGNVGETVNTVRSWLKES
ncbi:MAG: flagellar M-ring protein FliF [SAR324 cluster bacterium]|nr:flagellar M-ring protein FliF [SAR324 cluster bacterium]